MAMITIKRKENETKKLQKSFLLVKKLQQKHPNIRKKLPASLEALQRAFGMQDKNRIFEKIIISAQLSRRN